MIVIKTKKLFFNVLKYSLFFIAFYVFSLAKLKGLVPAFALAFFVSLIWCNNNVVTCFFLLAAASILANFNLIYLACNLTAASIFLVIYLVHLKRKKPLSVKALIYYYPLILLPFIGCSFLNMQTLVFALISVLISAVAFVVMIVFFDAIVMRKHKLHLSFDELFLGGIILIIAGLGLANFNIMGFNVGIVLALACCLFMALFKNKSLSLVFSLCLGTGFLLASSGLEPLAMLAIITLSFIALIESGKYFALIISSSTIIVLVYYFNLIIAFRLAYVLSFIAIVLLMVLIPNKVVEKIGELYYKKKATNVSEQIMKNFQRALYIKMFNAETVFKNLVSIFEPLENRNISKEDATKTLANEAMQNACEHCDNKIFCHRKSGFNINKAFYDLVDIGMSKGKISLLDIPSSMTTNCEKTGLLIDEVNELLKKWQQFKTMEENTVFYQSVISSELKMGARLIGQTAEKLNEKIVLNNNLETKISEELIYNNILLEEVLVVSEEKNMFSVNLVVTKDVYEESAIVGAVSKSLKCKMEITKVDTLEENKVMIELHPAPNYNLVFGVASLAKLGNELCGDKHSLLKVDNSNVLVSLCDGMGSGDKASNLSDTAMCLVENFYKAGLTINETAKAVNDILIINQVEDGFNAIDLLSLNMYNGTVDFIKLATPPSFIKKKSGLEIIKSEALPLGIVKTAGQAVVKKVIEAGDMVVIITDGIFDVLGENIIEKLILGSIEKNPQELADTILKRAQLVCKNAPPDDMTVLCVRIFSKM